MPYIDIDENRFQVASGNKANLTNPILIDCTSPSDCYKLKTDYESFSGEEQWEIDTTKQAEQDQITAYEVYQSKLIELKSEDEFNVYLQKTGVITQSQYDDRLAVVTVDTLMAKNEYLGV